MVFVLELSSIRFFLLASRSFAFSSFIAISRIVAAEYCSETLLFKYYVFQTVEFCYFHCGTFSLLQDNLDKMSHIKYPENVVLVAPQI